MSQPFDIKLMGKAVNAITTAGYKMMKGIYIYNGGDTFETREEIKVLDKMTEDLGGGRVVGMTTVPEVMLLNQMKIPFAAILSNVNYAEGLSKETLVSHEQTMDVMETAGKYMLNIVNKIISSYEKQI